MYLSRYKLLRKAYEKADLKTNPDYAEFLKEEKDWLQDYCLFMAIKNEKKGICWIDWPEEYRTWPENRQKLPAEVETEAQYQMFLQYIFYTQWMKVKKAANDAGIQIMGDVPFYVGQDSVEERGGNDNFHIDTAVRPIFIAGVPPE